MTKMKVNLTVNGQAHEVEAEPRQLLIHLLREDLNLTGPHIGCETSHCGACTIEMDGKSVKACTVFAAQAHGADITTIEGLSEPGPPRATRLTAAVLNVSGTTVSPGGPQRSSVSPSLTELSCALPAESRPIDRVHYSVLGPGYHAPRVPRAPSR